MKQITIERMIIGFLLILLVVVYLVQSRDRNRYDFYHVPDSFIVYKFDKQTGRVYFIQKNGIAEMGTTELFYKDDAWKK